MTIKKSIQCGNCRQYIDIYIEENMNLKGVTAKCKCGSEQYCIEDNRIISKWKEIRR